MRLNFFTYVFWPEPFLINELVQDLAQQGVEVHVLTGLPNYPKGEFLASHSLSKGPYSENYHGAFVMRYPMLPRKKGFFRLMVNYLTNILGASIMQFRLPKADWAFVFATSPITTAIPAILWARLSRAKVCIWLQDLWPESVAAVGATGRHSLLYKILGAVVRWIYKRTDLILIQSPGFVDNLKEFGYTGPFHVVPNWAPSVDFNRSATPEWLKDLPVGKITVTFAGNIGRAQGIDTIMAAAESLKENENIQFAIVGDGSDFERVKSQARERGLEHVHFFGRRPLADMPGLFQASDILMVTLKRDPIFARTIPSKIQAYMVAGKPIVASLDGVGGQVIQEAQCGLVSEAENGRLLAENILRIAGMASEQRKEMGSRAVEYFKKNYLKEKIISDIQHYLREH